MSTELIKTRSSRKTVYLTQHAAHSATCFIDVKRPALRKNPAARKTYLKVITNYAVEFELCSISGWNIGGPVFILLLGAMPVALRSTACQFGGVQFRR